MTLKVLISKNKKLKNAIVMISFLFCVFVLISYGNDAKNSIIYGIKLSAFSVIPSIFPFFILSDFLVGFYEDCESMLSKIFNKYFSISASAYPTFIIGNLCGFPLGIKYASQLYINQRITKSECEKLCMITNNPSLAFVISGVGAGMRGSVKEGVILYILTLLSSFVIGIFTKSDNTNFEYSKDNEEQTFNLSLTVKNAIYSSLNVSAYIIFFSALLGIFYAITKNAVLTTLISPFFEIGNAAMLISDSKILSPGVSYSLTAFSLGFSGLSVFMQAMSFLPKEISRVKIFFAKLLQGIICAASGYVIYTYI